MLAGTDRRGRATGGFILDDGELSRFAVGGHTLFDLEAELAILKPGLARKLAPLEALRFRRLYLRAEHAILTFRFMEAGAGKDEAAFQSAAETLYAYRVRNLNDLGRDEGQRWTAPTNGERVLWERTAHKPMPRGTKPKAK